MSMSDTASKRDGSVDSRLSSDSDFDDDDPEIAPPYTWLGRQINALVKELRNQDNSQNSFNVHHKNDSNAETTDAKISSGYAIIRSKRNRRSIKFRRRCIFLFTWTILLFNVVLVMSISVIQMVVKYQLPRTFGWHKILLVLEIPFSYEVNESCTDGPHSLKVKNDCSRFQEELFCPVVTGVSALHLLFTIPYLILLLPVGITFLHIKKSRPYLKTIISCLSSTVVFICLFNLSRAILMYRHVYLELKNQMIQEMDASSELVTQWWHKTQMEGQCCGVTKPQDWNGKYSGPSQASSSADVYPKSCCDHTKSRCSQSPGINEVYTQGCYQTELNKIHLYSILTVIILLLATIFLPLLKFLFYFIGRISKKYIGRKTGNLRTKYLRCEVYGSLELVGFHLSEKSSSMVFFGKELQPDDEIKARVNHQRIFKVLVRRKCKVIARIKVRSIARSEKNVKGRKVVKYRMANDLNQGVILINF